MLFKSILSVLALTLVSAEEKGFGHGHGHEHERCCRVEQPKIEHHIMDHSCKHFAKAAYDTNWRYNKGACGYEPCRLDGFIVAISKNCIPQACGECIKVKHGCKEVVVRVTDATPNCDNDRIVLGDCAFEKLAPLAVGVIDVEWEWTECPVYCGMLDKK